MAWVQIQALLLPSHTAPPDLFVQVQGSYYMESLIHFEAQRNCWHHPHVTHTERIRLLVKGLLTSKRISELGGRGLRHFPIHHRHFTDGERGSGPGRERGRTVFVTGPSGGHRALSSPLLPALSLFLYTHRRMAITGDDVCLDQIVPVSRDFTLEEGAQGGWVV